VTYVLIGAAFLVVVVVVALIRRRRTASPGSIRRDAPTVEMQETPRTRFGSRIGGVFRRGFDEALWAEVSRRPPLS
jgi:hypothetical protein